MKPSDIKIKREKTQCKKNKFRHFYFSQFLKLFDDTLSSVYVS
jgi:hypothetical protein